MIQVLELSGTPRQVGRAYGEACREGFHAFHAHVREQAVDNPRWYDEIHVMGKAIAAHYPRYYQELEGIAEGADMTLDDLLLNHRRLLLAEFLCCSNVAFLAGPAGPIFGKNLDGAAAGTPGPDRNFIARHCTYENGQEVVHTTIVGDLMSRDTCMNMHGLAFGGSSVGSIYQKSLYNPTLEAGLYAMLCNCATTAEAIRFLQRYPHVGKGYNFVMVDEGGDGVVLECASPMVQVRRPEPGSDAIYCTNHYNLPALQKADRRKPGGMVYSRKRWAYLERKLGQEDTPRTVQGIKGLLSAHHAPGGGLCRPIDDGDASVTLMSVVALPRTREFWVANGRPAEVAYERVV
jgi:predicted choloylglycine hydrolase